MVDSPPLLMGPSWVVHGQEPEGNGILPRYLSLKPVQYDPTGCLQIESLSFDSLLVDLQ